MLAFFAEGDEQLLQAIVTAGHFDALCGAALDRFAHFDRGSEAVWWRSDPFFGVLLIMSFGLFILAGLTTIIYRATKAQDEVQASAS